MWRNRVVVEFLQWLRECFVAEQNAHVVRNAERYYRAMFRGGAKSWNLRDQHMMSTLDALLAHISRMNGEARTVS